MAPDQWPIILTALITAMTTVLVVGIPATLAYLQARMSFIQSQANQQGITDAKKAIAENTEISIKTGHSVDGRITEMLAKIEEANVVQRNLAVTIERMAGNERTAAAVQDERVAAMARSISVTAELPKSIGETAPPG